MSKSFGKIKEYSFPHSYSELPNGNIISTFQTKGGINTVGGLVEFSPEGKYLRSSDAEIQEDPVFLRPYGIVLVQNLIVSLQQTMICTKPTIPTTSKFGT